MNELRTITTDYRNRSNTQDERWQHKGIIRIINNEYSSIRWSKDIIPEAFEKHVKIINNRSKIVKVFLTFPVVRSGKKNCFASLYDKENKPFSFMRKLLLRFFFLRWLFDFLTLSALRFFLNLNEIEFFFFVFLG